MKGEITDRSPARASFNFGQVEPRKIKYELQQMSPRSLMF